MTKICEICNKPFESTDSKKKYCSCECYEVAHYKNRKIRISTKIFIQKTCRCCAKTFETYLSTKIFCSKQCSKKERSLKGDNHTKQNSNTTKKVSYEEAINRLKENNVDYVTLDESDYISWKTKSRFFDLIQQDFFLCTPYTLCRNKIVHPKRRQDKKKTTCRIKYNADHPQQSSTVKEKLSKSLKSHTNINNIEDSKSKRFIKETGEHLSTWYERQSCPKPAYSTLQQVFPNELVCLKNLEGYIKGYKNSKSSLEIMCEELFNIKHHNKYVPGLKYRPDFKLNETTYLNADGIYWHSEEYKGKDYHFKMRKEFESKGLFLFQFYDCELKTKTDIIKSIVNHYTINKKTNEHESYRIKEVQQNIADVFLNKNHLDGTINAQHVGLYNKDNIIECLFSYTAVNGILTIERMSNNIELTSFNSRSYVNQFIEYVSTKQIKNIQYKLNLRYETDDPFEINGFLTTEEYMDWCWSDDNNTHHKDFCTNNMDDRKLSVEQYAKELRCHKIYDAGQRILTKKVNMPNIDLLY